MLVILYAYELFGCTDVSTEKVKGVIPPCRGCPEDSAIMMTDGAVYTLHNQRTDFVRTGDVVRVCNEKSPTKYLDRTSQIRLTDGINQLTAFADESLWSGHAPACK